MIISNDMKSPMIKFKPIQKALRKLEINWNVLNLIKGNFKKSTANKLYSEILDTFSLRLGTRENISS